MWYDNNYAPYIAGLSLHLPWGDNVRIIAHATDGTVLVYSNELYLAPYQYPEPTVSIWTQITSFFSRLFGFA